MANNAFSAVVPCRNGGTFLDDFIPNLTSTLSPDDEVIFIDDHSTDDSYSRALRLVSHDQRFRIIRNPSAQGLVNALNFGIREASHNWIARFDVDDLYSHRRLLLQRSLLDPDVSAIFSDYQFINSVGKGLGVIPSAIFEDTVELSILGGSRTPHSGAIFNRAAFFEAGGYQESDYLAEDLGLWLRLSHFGNMKSIPEVILSYRLHSGSVTSLNRTDSSKQRGNLIIKYGLNKKKIDKCFRDFRSIIERYAEAPYAEGRIILFYRDLFLASKLNLNEQSHMIEVRRQFVKDCANYGSFRELTGMYTERYKRNQLRKTSNRA
jgi:glycosyltransferase involved in cell wall biosynthesis